MACITPIQNGPVFREHSKIFGAVRHPVAGNAQVFGKASVMTDPELAAMRDHGCAGRNTGIVAGPYNADAFGVAITGMASHGGGATQIALVHLDN